MDTFSVIFSEDGTNTILGRAVARDGTGSASPVATEGNLIKRADLSSATVAVYDLSSATPETAVYSATLTISTVIYETLQTSGIWGLVADGEGGNFLCDLPPAAFPTGGHTYQVEVKLTTTGGSVGWGRWVGPALGVQTS